MKKSSIGWAKRMWLDGAGARAKDLQFEKKLSVWICGDWTLRVSQKCSTKPKQCTEKTSKICGRQSLICSLVQWLVKQERKMFP